MIAEAFVEMLPMAARKQTRSDRALALAAAGHSNKAIAIELGISEATVSRALRGQLAAHPSDILAGLDHTPALTHAERAVAALAAAGESNDAIARRRASAPRTVANQLASVYAKLGVSSRRSLASFLLGRRKK